MLTIVIPSLNEAACIGATLQPLQRWRNEGVEVILSDGGSQDNTVEIAKPLVDRVVAARKGRARQMNAGAAVAKGQYLLFLHADTELPANFFRRRGNWREQAVQWGFFPVRLSGQQRAFRFIEFFINWRSRSTSVATGDQCIFVKRELFKRLGGFSDIPIMEDIAFTKRLRRIAPPFIESPAVLTSSRRWEERGILRTVLLMWQLRLAYFLGVNPRWLARVYYPERSNENASR